MSYITLVGNIGEPALRITATGKSMMTFGLAVNRKVGEEDKTTWFNIKCWGELAENLAEEIGKGDRLIVSGFIENEEYTDKDGNERKSTVVVANEAGKSLRWAKRN
jgi:single-strand DNA-binding protein